MKKSLAALAVAAAFANIAYAQSNITIYGVVDIGFVKENGRDVRLADYDNNRIGFKGTEDLGNGYKAIFDLQRRFDLNDGTLGNSNTAGFTGSKSSNQKDWEGAAWVGLSGPFGQIRLGRINQIETEFIRKFDPFNHIGVTTQFYGLQRNARIDNTIRYDSPKFSNFGVSVSYSLGNNTDSDSITDAVKTNLKDNGADNDGYEIGLFYDNGSFSATANWSRVADSNDSNVWSVGAAWRFENKAKISALYQDTDSKGWKGGSSGYTYNSRYVGRMRNLLIGGQYPIGNGVLNASVQWNRLGNTASWNETQDAYRYSLGYTYNLSKRTAVYGNVAYTDYDSDAMGYVYSGLERNSIAAVQLGVQHKF